MFGDDSEVCLRVADAIKSGKTVRNELIHEIQLELRRSHMLTKNVCIHHTVTLAYPMLI